MKQLTSTCTTYCRKICRFDSFAQNLTCRRMKTMAKATPPSTCVRTRPAKSLDNKKTLTNHTGTKVKAKERDLHLASLKTRTICLFLPLFDAKGDEKKILPKTRFNVGPQRPPLFGPARDLLKVCIFDICACNLPAPHFVVHLSGVSQRCNRLNKSRTPNDRHYLVTKP